MLFIAWFLSRFVIEHLKKSIDDLLLLLGNLTDTITSLKEHASRLRGPSNNNHISI